MFRALLELLRTFCKQPSKDVTVKYVTVVICNIRVRALCSVHLNSVHSLHRCSDVLVIMLIENFVASCLSENAQ